MPVVLLDRIVVGTVGVRFIPPLVTPLVRLLFAVAPVMAGFLLGSLKGMIGLGILGQ
jgi:hypothetical protein